MRKRKPTTLVSTENPVISTTVLTSDFILPPNLLYYEARPFNTIKKEVLMQKSFLPFYIVKKGDTLASIASKFEVSPTQILVENYITPSSIKEGTILSITKK